MTDSTVAELAQRLAREAEAVCRYYLPNGRREGGYWLVGDVGNRPGRSLFVRLRGPDSGKGAAGKWTDAATGEHGDLLDLIAANRHHASLCQTLDEARHFLNLPRHEPPAPQPPVPTGSPEAARRLFAMARPVPGTIAQAYLYQRGIRGPLGADTLRCHPYCYYRPGRDDPDGTPKAWPALLAAVTDLAGSITGLHRTWLDPSGRGKAPLATPRRAMGLLHGHGVRFGTGHDVLAAGEGLETVLSLRTVLPDLPVVATLSAAHLAAFLFPAGLRRLYVALDDDPAGRGAADQLMARAEAAGIAALRLRPMLGDFNDDLVHRGPAALLAGLRGQLAPEDQARFASWQRRGPAGRLRSHARMAGQPIGG